MTGINLSEELNRIISDRMISRHEIVQVMENAEKTDRKLLNRLNGHFLAHSTIGKVTFWAEYSRLGDGWAVHNAHSHRMRILEAPES
jgi:hypothetical protein